MNKKTELFLHALRLLIRRSIYLLQTEYRAEHVAERWSEAVSGVTEIHVSGERIFAAHASLTFSATQGQMKTKSGLMVCSGVV